MIHIRPINLRDANHFVSRHHRHCKAVAGCKFCLQIIDSIGFTRGVLIAGRPISRLLDDGVTLEITRLCTDGIRNGCSKLYGAAARVAASMGYQKIITYTLNHEAGSSLRAVGWRPIEGVGGGAWIRNGRATSSHADTGKKTRWEKCLASHLEV
jgi:hypothetical protein